MLSERCSSRSSTRALPTLIGAVLSAEGPQQADKKGGLLRAPFCAPAHPLCHEHHHGCGSTAHHLAA